MCGRFALPDETLVASHLPIDRWNWHWPAPRYNVAPTAHVPMVFMAEEGLLELNGARWGLIPHWWKKDVPPSLTFNAKRDLTMHPCTCDLRMKSEKVRQWLAERD